MDKQTARKKMQAVRQVKNSKLIKKLIVFLDFDYFLTVVVAACRASGMTQYRLMTFRAF